MAKSNGQQTTVDPQANEWISKAMEDGVKPEQALAFMGLGLMQRLNGEDNSFTTIWQESQEGQADLHSLRQRLELIDLAIRTGAPLSTSEVGALLGARPGSAMVERGGVQAKRISRNIWKLSRNEDSSERGGYGDAFRRRL